MKMLRFWKPAELFPPPTSVRRCQLASTDSTKYKAVFWTQMAANLRKYMKQDAFMNSQQLRI